jgi:hypothetical protein
MGNFHETYKSLETIKTPSDRAFGLTLSAILFTIGALKTILWSWWIGGFFIGLSAILLALTFYRTGIVGKIKHGFLKIAPVIARVLNPVLMALLYAMCFIPGGFAMRLFRYDPLKRAYDPYAVSYWQKREDSGLPDPMKYQF